jgi:cytochrome c oxidase assembly protein subunit 15
MADVPALTSFLRSPATLRRLALASLIANIGIVGTGGAVRLTGSGLGCPTWPRCSDGSYTTTQALGTHGLIEFGNRTLTFVLGLLALLVLVAVLLRRDRSRAMTVGATAVLAGIPAQAVVGGLTVLTHLNPWVVACHFLVTMGVIAAAYLTWLACAEPRQGPDAAATAGAGAGRTGTGRTGTGTGPTATGSAAPLRQLAWLVVGVAAVTVVVGTVVTASGPHAGDEHAHRTGLDPATMTNVHSAAAFLLVGLTFAAWFTLRTAGAPLAARAGLVLLGVEAAQGAIGVVQSATHLPAILVGLHMVGSCLVWIAAIALLVEVRRTTAPSVEDSSLPAGV